MVHEPFLAFGEGNWKQDFAAVVHRVMIVMILASSRQIWTSADAWIPKLRAWTLRGRTGIESLAIPSSIRLVPSPDRVRELRESFGADRILVGHFGTYGTSITEILRRLLPLLLQRLPNSVVVLMGGQSRRFREELIGQHPGLAGRVVATGHLDEESTSAHLQAFDLLLQPFPDGVTTRRTSIMSALSHGRPAITTFGRLSEPFWKECGAVATHDVDDEEGFIRVLDALGTDREAREALGRQAKSFYEAKFDIRHTVERLRQSMACESS
jgi:glycosyltransferase involved in cell wall biosynthesis